MVSDHRSTEVISNPSLFVSSATSFSLNDGVNLSFSNPKYTPDMPEGYWLDRPPDGNFSNATLDPRKVGSFTLPAAAASQAHPISIATVSFVDTGADYNCISLSLVTKLRLTYSLPNYELPTITDVNLNAVQPLGLLTCSVDVILEDSCTHAPIRLTLDAYTIVLTHMPHPIILGLPFLRFQKALLDPCSLTIHIGEHHFSRASNTPTIKIFPKFARLFFLVHLVILTFPCFFLMNPWSHKLG